jgi:hypothetical protein
MASLHGTPFVRSAAVRQGRWHVFALVVVAAFGVACSDGYPTQDAPQVNPVDMTLQELLQQLNQIGDQAHLDRRWQYALASGCELTVLTSKRFRGERKAVMPLTGAEISMRAEGPDSYEVLIQPSTEAKQELIALEGGTWADGLRMRSLLDFLRIRCIAA